MSQSSLDGVLVVNKKFKHPEVAAYIINLYCELLYSENPTYEYWYWDTATGELTYNIGPFEILDQGINLNPYRDMKKVWAGEMTVEELNPYSRYYYDMVNTDWAWNTMWGPGEHTAGVVLDFLVNNPEYIVQNAYVGMPTETQQDRGSVLGEIRKTAYIQIITGYVDVDEGFDKMVKDYMKAGGQDIEDEINDWYQANKK
jgi:putative aldouronate transport system substrate-binding protein